MTVRHMRLMLGLFFLLAGTALLAARLLAPAVVANVLKLDLTRLLLGSLLALVLGGVNLAKWYAGRMAYEQLTTPVRRPLQPDRATEPGDNEPNPAFDFSKPEQKPNS